jgi:signal recognition particle subunit SRP54
MVLEALGNSLRNTLKKIANASRIDADLVDEVVKEIQRALLQGDVNVKLVLELTKEIKRRALTEKPPAGMSSREHVVRIVYDELVKILGNTKELSLTKHVIMMIGLYGQGKTTTAGKLAKYFQKRGITTAMIAADIHRPAAVDQLVQIGKSINLPVYTKPGENKAVKIVREGLNELKNYDVIIIDTAGRHSLEDDLIDEMKRISTIAKPDEKILVLDGSIGQAAGVQAKAFHESIGITGVMITKLDGTAKGGGAISAVAETKTPIIFIGVGEHIDDLEKFEPPRFISRLLGMGDIQSLLEKAQETVDEEEAEETAKKLMSGKFSLKDMYKQMEMMSSMGPLSKIMDMLPSAFAQNIKKEDVNVVQKRLKKFRVIMDSMTDFELENPTEIKSSRVARIARGAGVDQKDVRELLHQYNTSKKMMKGFMGNRKMRKMLMQQMKDGSIG